VLLLHPLDQGLSRTTIAHQTGLSRRLIYHELTTGQLVRDLGALGPRTRAQRPAKLEPHKPIIVAQLASYAELTAVTLFEEVRAAGYTGSLTRLKVLVRQVQPVPPPEAVVNFETAPGLQAQADFADFKFA